MRTSCRQSRRSEITAFCAAALLWGIALAPSESASLPAPSAAVLADPAPRLTHARAAPEVVSAAATQPVGRDADIDVLAQNYPLDIGELRRLNPGDRLRLSDPEGGDIDLEVVNVTLQAAGATIQLEANGLPTTITHGADTYHATVATARGVYALSNDGGAPLLVRHAELEQRMNHHAVDFRVRPAG